MALPEININTTLVRNALAAASNAVKVLCQSSSINQWSLYKAANYGAGFDTKTKEGYPIGISSDATGNRLGDFRGYDHDAIPPIEIVGVTGNTNDGLTVTIAATANTGMMFPTSNNNGFNPTYLYDLSDNDTIRLTAEVWSTGDVSLIKAGTAVTFTKTTLHGANVTLHQLLIPPTLVAAIRSIRVKQEYQSGGSWFAGGYIDGGSYPFTIEVGTGVEATVVITNVTYSGGNFTVTYNVTAISGILNLIFNGLGFPSTAGPTTVPNVSTTGTGRTVILALNGSATGTISFTTTTNTTGANVTSNIYDYIF